MADIREEYRDSALYRRIIRDPVAGTETVLDGNMTQISQRAMTADEIDAYYESQRSDPTEAMRLAAQLTVNAKVLAAELDDDTVAALAPLYDPWKPGLAVTVGSLYAWDGTIVECVQAHTTQADWTPDATPALWKIHRTTQGPTPDEWVQPTGAQDAYKIGDRVTFEGHVYESLIDGNTWSPTAYPAGWRLIDG